MSDCIFCKIIDKQIPGDVVYEDDHILAFRDINPKAEVHVLVIPKKHIDSLAHLEAEDHQVVGHLTLKLREIAHQEGLQSGFRTIVNTGRGGGQEVDHIHYHILGGVGLPGF